VIDPAPHVPRPRSLRALPAHRAHPRNVTPTDPESTDAHADRRSHDQERRAMTWAQCLEGMLGIDVKTCPFCGGAALMVAAVDRPTAIRRFLAHVERHGALQNAYRRPVPCSPPAAAA
jgi:hypothetical protein